MNLWRDLRFGLRTLLGRPGFTLATVLTLAIGIGANTTIFTLADGVLLRPLPYGEPDRIVGFWGTYSWSRGELAFMRERAASYEHVAGYSSGNLVLTDLDEPVSVPAGAVSSNLFSVLGVEAARGRVFLPEEEQPGRQHVAILSDGLWREVFGADAGIVGRTVHLDDVAFEVVGVMPRGFKFPSAEARMWIPITMDPSSGGFRGGHYLGLVGRLRPGVTLAAAQGELETLVLQLKEEFDLKEGFDKLATPPVVVPFHDQVVGQARLALIVLAGAVGIVLLIACVNVANMLMARGVKRRREMAIRSALGARRRTLVAQLFVESSLLAAIGGGVGLLLSLWGVDTIVSLLPPDTPRIDGIAVDPRALIFCAGVSAVAVLLFGLLPALQAAGADLRSPLADGSRTGGGVRRRSRQALVTVEVALAVVLVAAAGLLTRSFAALNAVDPGFSAARVLSLRVSLATAQYRDPQQRLRFFDEALAGIRTLPGVEAVGANWRLPIADRGAYQILEIEGDPTPAGDPARSVYWRAIAGDYFSAMGIPLVAGRRLASDDIASGLPVCVINETMARRFWPDGDALGHRIRNSMDDDTWITIVGVVGDVRHNGIREKAQYMMYRPYAQGPPWIRNLSLVVRAAGDPASLARSVQQAIRQVDPKVATLRVQTMQDVVTESIADTRLTAGLIGAFGAVALLLAAIGVFGVLSFFVSQRTAEMGVRMALGASPRDLQALILREGLAPALVGGALGVTGALIVTRLMSGLLFGVVPADPFTFIAVVGVLVAVAVTACYLPARRAARVDPVTALRFD